MMIQDTKAPRARWARLETVFGLAQECDAMLTQRAGTGTDLIDPPSDYCRRMVDASSHSTTSSLPLLQVRLCVLVVVVAVVMPLCRSLMMRMQLCRLALASCSLSVVTPSSHMLFSAIVTLADRVSDSVAITFCTDLNLLLVVGSEKTSY